MTIAKIAAVPHWKVIMQSGTSDDREGWAKTREEQQQKTDTYPPRTLKHNHESTSPEQNKEQFSPDIRGSILETAFGKEAPCGTRRPTVILLVQTVDTTVDSQFKELEWNDRGTVEGRLSCGSWSQWQTIYWSFTEP